MNGDYEAALTQYQKALETFEKIGSPNANIVKDNIALCREKMTEERFKAILKENGMMNDE